MRHATYVARDSTLRGAVEMLRAELHDPDLTIAVVARRLCVSRRQLQRCFELAGTSFSEALTRLRMIRARQLLRTGTLTVEEVSRRCGYRSPQHFAKRFRETFGVPPSALRFSAGGSQGHSTVVRH